MTTDHYSLVGDIGGTNARFALIRSGEVTPEAIEVLPCSDYLRRSGVETVQEVCLAVAPPVSVTRVRMTNSHWHFNSGEVRRCFGWSSLKVINDFTGMALGIPHVSADKLVHVCGGPGDGRRPRLVIGPGTGLGVSGLVPLKEGWAPLTTLGGDVDFAPTDDMEVAILKLLKARFGRVSAERLLCGSGLLNLYQAHEIIQSESNTFV